MFLRSLKMKRYFIFYFCYFLFLIETSAAISLSGSPGSIVLQAGPNEETCTIIFLSSDDYSGELGSRLAWSGKDNFVENLNNFNFTSEELKLNVEYPEVISDFDGDTEAEICISGEEIGTYRGYISYYALSGTDKNIGTGVGVGIWIKLTVEEPSQPISTSGSSQTSSSGGGGGSRTPRTNTTVHENQEASPTNTTTQEQPLSNNQNLPQENETSLDEQTSEVAPITGAAIGSPIKRNFSIVIITLILIAVISIIVYKRRNTIPQTPKPINIR